jgi:hypothetical protein
MCRNGLGSYRQFYATLPDKDFADGLTLKSGAALQPIPTLKTSPSNSFHRGTPATLAFQIAIFIIKFPVNHILDGVVIYVQSRYKA